MNKGLIIGGIVAAAALLFSRKAGAAVLPGTPMASSNPYWDWPVPANATLTSRFGCRPNIPGISFKPSPNCPSGQNFHNGIDLARPRGTPVFAAGGGTVSVVSSDSVSGNFVNIGHGSGWASVYCHLDRALVSPGQRVEAGDLIGVMGSTGASTGSHLHFMTTYNGVAKDPQVVIGAW